MTPLEDKLRAALRETAAEIPADPPPLRLRTRRRSGRRGWITWAAPLASAAVVVAVIAGALAVTHSGPAPRATTAPTPLAGLPPYYVALTSPNGHPDVTADTATTVEVRATATAAVLARIVVPKPYAAFTGVTAAADDRTFVLVAEEKSDPPASRQQFAREYPHGYYPPSRFYLLRIDPHAASTAERASLQALPLAFVPANDQVRDMALSPDGTSLAADVGTPAGDAPLDTHLFVFNLVTGTKRAWSFTDCSGCGPTSGGLGYGSLTIDALSWTADGRYIAFVGPGRSLRGASAVRLLDTRAPGSDLLANSKPVVPWPGGANPQGSWRGAIVTPDGRTAVVIEELPSNGPPLQVREALVKCSTATGQVTKTVNNLNVLAGYDGYEQVLYTNDTGSLMVVSYARPGMSTGILQGGTYTPIPWDPDTATAAW